MKNILYIIGFCFSIALIGCQKDKYFLYNDVGRIQFGPSPDMLYYSGAELRDTVKAYTFFYEKDDLTKDTVYFDVYTVGGIKPDDRHFKLEQIEVEGKLNAVSGVHFEPFDSELSVSNFVIKKDSVHATVPIILLRDLSLKDTSVVLRFKLVENDDFALGQEANLWREVNYTDRLSQPNMWDATSSRYYFGDYSEVKHKFMIDSTGQKWDDEFITFIRIDYSLLQYWVGRCKNALIKYNNAHPTAPLKDENGELVIFP